MESSHNPPSDFAPLTAESRALYQEFWGQIGCATTAPPMDFLALKSGALEWGERLKLADGILAKFRQRIKAAQSEREVSAVMGDPRMPSADFRMPKDNGELRRNGEWLGHEVIGRSFGRYSTPFGIRQSAFGIPANGVRT